MDFEKMLRENRSMRSRVVKKLIDLGLDYQLKGFRYMVDILTISLCNKKYSPTFMSEVIPFIAKREGIKEFSVQRQLRYTCTIKTNGKHIPNDIARDVWVAIKKDLGEY